MSILFSAGYMTLYFLTIFLVNLGFFLSCFVFLYLWPLISSFALSLEFNFFYALLMSWVNETSENSRNHYRASHRRESIKTKQENKLLRIASEYILFTSSFDSFYLLLLFRDRLQIWCFQIQTGFDLPLLLIVFR